MHIQWFPGHMTKSMRMIEENLPLTDAVVYVLDARAPYSCLNPKFDKLINNKKILYLLNKSDLSDPVKTKMWKDLFIKNGNGNTSCLAVNGTVLSSARIILAELYKLLNEKIARMKTKGVKLPIRVMVLGIPNSGKSTVINTLCGSKRAKTGDKPGVTRGKQWIKIEDFEILDTPGTLWNAFADQQSARNLAYVGSINDDILDGTDLATIFIDEVKKLYPNLLKERYKLTDIEKNGVELLQEICKNRGFLMKGGIDTDRGSVAVIDDFRKGRIGKITLEIPNNA